MGNAWKHLTYAVAGNNITKDQEIFKNINGISVSPKKTFCIMKIWMKDCSFQNPHKLSKVNGINYQGCLFKKHYS